MLFGLFGIDPVKLTADNIFNQKFAKPFNFAVKPRAFNTFEPRKARSYDIHTNLPIFCSRDGVPKRTLAEISYERRNGYSWLGYYAQGLLQDELPRWKRRLERD